MTTEQTLQDRAASKCELCAATDALRSYPIPPDSDGSADQCLLICATCNQQLDQPDNLDPQHWRCLNDSMWSQVPAVQVMAWRILKRLNDEAWAQNALDMLYLDDATLSWAQAGADEDNTETSTKTVDSNGALLSAGDTVTLIKDLNVKGANFTAKRGTAVRGISLVADNPEHIEGRVNGQQIVILTKFVKRST